VPPFPPVGGFVGALLPAAVGGVGAPLPAAGAGGFVGLGAPPLDTGCRDVGLIVGPVGEEPARPVGEPLPATCVSGALDPLSPVGKPSVWLFVQPTEITYVANAMRSARRNTA
jgi:hypothetical protein